MDAKETTDAEENYNKTVGVGSYYSSTVHKISPFRSFKSILPNMEKTNKSMVPGKFRTRTLVHGASADSMLTSSEPEGALKEQPRHTLTNTEEKVGENSKPSF